MDFFLSQNEVLLADDFIGLTSAEEFDNSFFSLADVRTETENSVQPADRNV